MKNMGVMITKSRTKEKVKLFFDIGAERASEVIPKKWVTLINYLFDNITYEYKHTFTQAADLLQIPETSIRSTIYGMLDEVIERYGKKEEGRKNADTNANAGIIERMMNTPHVLPPEPPMTYETSFTPLAAVMMTMGYKLTGMREGKDAYSYDKFFFKFNIEDTEKFEKLKVQFDKDELLLPAKTMFEHNKTLHRMMYEARKGYNITGGPR